MKSFVSKFNPVAGLFVLGAAVPAAVYLIGIITSLLWAIVGLLLFPGSTIQDAFLNIMAIISLVLQCVGVMILTVLLTVFSDFKAKHVLLSLPVTAALFFLVERFFFGNVLNYLVDFAFFRKLYKYIGLDNANEETYLKMRPYLIDTLMLTAGSAVLVLLAWGVVRIIIRREEKQET